MRWVKKFSSAWIVNSMRGRRFRDARMVLGVFPMENIFSMSINIQSSVFCLNSPLLLQ